MLKSTFADLLECGEKEIGRKEKRPSYSGNTNFQRKFRFSYFGGFLRKFGGFHILQIKKPPKRRLFHPFPVDKVKHVQQLKGNEYETRNNEHPVLHSEDKTPEKQ